jgi:hypothetical protein
MRRICAARRFGALSYVKPNAPVLTRQALGGMKRKRPQSGGLSLRDLVTTVVHAARAARPIQAPPRP